MRDRLYHLHASLINDKRFEDLERSARINHTESSCIKNMGYDERCARFERIAKIYTLPDFQEVFKLVNNLQTDVHSDTMYPNTMRPENNPGYNIRYTRNQ